MITQIKVELWIHIRTNTAFDIIPINISPYYRRTVHTDNFQKALIFISPWLRDTEGYFHVFL